MAFAAAILTHAAIALFLLRQEPEPGIRPDAERVAAILLGRVDGTDGDPPAEFAESIDAEIVTEVEGATEVPPREAAPTPPRTASAPPPDDAVAIAAIEATGRLPLEEVVSTPPAPATPASPEDAAMLDALPTDTHPPPEEALSMPPAPAAPASPEDAVALDALPTDTRPPREEALSMPPAPASPASPEDAVTFAAPDAERRPPPEEVIATPPAPATPASPEDTMVLAALQTDTRPPPEEAISTLPELARLPSPEDALALAAIEAAGRRPPREAVSIPPEEVLSSPPEQSTPPLPEVAVILAATEAARRLTPEDAVSILSEPAHPPSLVPPPANPPARDSVPEPVRLVAAESVGPAHALSTVEPAEIVASAETAAPRMDSPELAAEVRNIDEAGDYSPLPEADPTPPESAMAAPLQNAEVLTVVEGAGLTPLVEATSTPSIEPVSIEAPPSGSVPEPVRLVTAESVGPAPSPAAVESAEIVASTEAVPSIRDSQELAAEVRNIDEASDYSPLQEAASTPPESAKAAPLENAEVLTAVEGAGLTPLVEATSTPSIEPVSAEARASGSVPESVRLVRAESVDPAPSPAAVEPAEIVASIETVAPSRDSQELAVEVPDIDEATTASPLLVAVSILPGPTSSPPLEEAEVLTAIERAGSPRLEAAVSSPPVPAETVGPTEEVKMRAAIDPMAFTPAPGGSEAQQAQQAPEADDETGAPPGVAEHEGISAGRAEYLARLQQRLFKRLTYPHVARSHRQTGTASLYIAVDRTGRVQLYELRTSTGHQLLDREVRAMVERARPFPPFPDEMREAHLEVLLNVEFVLN